MKQLSLRNNRLKFETSGLLPIILEESIEYNASTNESNIRRCEHVTNRWDLESLGSLTDCVCQKPYFPGTEVATSCNVSNRRLAALFNPVHRSMGVFACLFSSANSFCVEAACGRQAAAGRH